MKKLKDFFKTHCLFFFHDWECTNEMPNLLYGEAAYWHIHRCKKCKAERISLIVDCNLFKTKNA